MSIPQPLLTVGPAPHLRTRYTVKSKNYAYLLGLLPLAAAAAVTSTHGPLAALGLLALGLGAGVLGEYVIQVVLRQSYRADDGHGALLGLLLALLLPASAPWWVLLVGVLLAILVGKQIYGGIGCYPFHPAMVAWVVLLLSWPHYVYPVGGASLGASGCLCTAAVALGGTVLLLLGHLKWRVTMGVILGVVLFGAMFGALVPDLANPFSQVVTGNVLLAAFFIATDSTSSPANRASQWVFGLGVGLMVMLVRAYGFWPDAVPFAVMLMNILSPLLERIRPRALEVSHG